MFESSNQLTALTYFLAVLLTGLFIRFWIIRWAHTWARKTETKLDDVIISAVDKPILIWAVLGGFYAAHPYLGITLPTQLASILDRLVLAALILSISWSLANLAGGVFRYYGHRIGAAVQITSLSQLMAKLLVLVIGIIVVLAEFGVEVTPIVASLGIGGLAIALALQDTLANMFSGFYILAEKSIRVGDFINVEGAGEGRVVDIGWRTTKIVTLFNNMLVIPNKKLAEVIVTNYDLPEHNLGLSTTVSVGFGEDPERIEAIVYDEASKAVSELEGADPAFKPVVRFTVGEYSLNYTVIWRALDIKYRYQLIHQMNMRLFKRLRSEGLRYLSQYELYTSKADRANRIALQNQNLTPPQTHESKNYPAQHAAKVEDTRNHSTVNHVTAPVVNDAARAARLPRTEKIIAVLGRNPFPTKVF
jgi:small-conductance mechanosensitive channel